MSEARCALGSIEIEATSRFRTVFLARIPSSHTMEDVLAPEYFGQLIPVHDFREFDLIEVEWEDGTKWGKLQIRAVEKTLSIVSVREREEIREEASTKDLPAGWTMKFVGGGTRWIIYNGDQPVEAGFPTPERARNRIAMLAVQSAHRQAMVDEVATPKRKGRPPKAATDTMATAEAAEA